MGVTVEETQTAGPLAVIVGAFGSAAETLGEVTVNARASAKSAAKSVGGVFSAGVYKAAYGLSYGVVFAGAFVTELMPTDNSIRRGFEEGAEAARDSVAKRHEAAPVRRAKATTPRKRAAAAVAVKAPVKRTARKAARAAKVETASEN